MFVIILSLPVIGLLEKMNFKDLEENNRRREIEFFLREFEALLQEMPNINSKEKAYINTARPQRIVGGNIVYD